MNRLNDLPKRQREAWLRENGIKKLGVIQRQESSVKYAIENNSVEEIAEWLKNATTVLFDESAAPYFCTVYEFNRLHEYVSANGEKESRA